MADSRNEHVFYIGSIKLHLSNEEFRSSKKSAKIKVSGLEKKNMMRLLPNLIKFDCEDHRRRTTSVAWKIKWAAVCCIKEISFGEYCTRK